MSSINHSNKSAWQSGVLIPLWVLQYLAVLGNIGVWLLIIIETGIYGYWYAFENENYYPRSFLFISTIILLICDTIVFVTISRQIHHYRKSKLSATKLFRASVVISIYYSICLLIQILGVTGFIDGGDKIFSDLCTTAIATALFYGMGIYAFVIKRRRDSTGERYGMMDYVKESDGGESV